MPDETDVDVEQLSADVGRLLAESEAQQSFSTEHLISRTKAQLPTAGVKNNARAFATDGRKAGEGASSGTGVPVFFDEAAGVWMSYRTDAEVTV